MLIPKVDNLKTSSDHCLTSLTNTCLKMVSKLLASRMSRVIDDLVDVTQSAFTKERYIMDNIETAEELLFNLQKGKIF